jgi:hypothetical protein
MGHRLSGTGYTARLVGTTTGARTGAAARARHTDTTEPRCRNANRPTVGARSDSGDAPPSPNPPTTRPALTTIDGYKNTPRPRKRVAVPAIPDAPRPAHADPPPSRTSRSPWRIARDVRVAAAVRPLVAWTAHESLRRLAWALRPLIDRGLDAPRIAGELSAWHLGDWRPLRPAAFITARLRREAALQAQRDAERAATVHPMDNAAWRDCMRELYPNTPNPSPPPRTDRTRQDARTAGRLDFTRVIEHLERDFVDALDLYGTDLVRRAGNLATSTTIHWTVH